MRNVVVSVATALLVAVLLVLRHGGLGAIGAIGGGGENSYAFLDHQPGSAAIPVTYSSCKPVRVEFDLAGIGDRAVARQVLLQAMGEVSAASHLNLVYVGDTARRPRYPDSTLTVEGGAWPVLIAFTDRTEVPVLEDNAGVGGSAWIERNGTRTYVSGQISLHRQYFDSLLGHGRDLPEARAIVMHELGHVLGLAHVHDSSELMYEHNVGRTTLGPGDRHGLALLGQGPCT